MQLILMSLRIISTLLWIYSVLCSIRIVLTWIPDLRNGFTNFLSNVCDPYLNFFTRRRMLTIGALDFSCILALAILYMLSIFTGELGASGTLSLAFIVSIVVKTIWEIISSIIGFLTILFIIRFIVILCQGNSFHVSTIWKFFDSAFTPMIYKIANTFSGGKLIPYKTALLIDIIVLILLNIAGTLFFVQLNKLIMLIPF